MRALALVMADLERDALGAPSTLEAELAGRPVLRATLERLCRLAGLEGIILAGPGAQEARLRELAGPVPLLAVVRTEPGKARRMMRSARAFARHGWRGGLAGTTVHDETYDPAVVQQVLDHSGADVLLLVGAGAALLDIEWTQAQLALLRESDCRYPMSFCQAPPGLAGLALTGKTLRGLIGVRQYPGRLFAYQPGASIQDPIHQAFNHALPDGLIATYHRLLADSPRGLWLCRQIVEQTGPEVDGPAACRIAQTLPAEPWPRELTIELTVARPLEDDLRPAADRPDLVVDTLAEILAGLDEAGDVNIMLAGAGDPLLHPRWADAARAAAVVGPVGLATYGVTLDERTMDRLIDSPISVVQVNVDALGEESYAAFKRGGAASAAGVWAAIEGLTQRARAAGRENLMVVPAMLKTSATLEEQSEFFDRALQTTGWGLFVEPSTWAGKWPDRGVVHMAPPVRTPCRRLGARLTVLADGTVTACEEDLHARRPLGAGAALAVWRGEALASLRARHQRGAWSDDSLCGACEEFHRP